MSVYVDDAHISYGRMKMSHMVADTHAELVQMAKDIGLATRRMQYKGKDNEHFDVSSAYRSKAISKGAIEINSRGLVKIIRMKRKEREQKASDAFDKALDVAVIEVNDEAVVPVDGDEYDDANPSA